MTIMLENVVENGTANNISLDDKVDCAGKTGTTQNNYDRWFIGYTPYYIGGVWYGYEYPKSLSGSNLCLDIWDDVMTQLHERIALKGASRPKSFYRSENIVECSYCADSGMLVTNACMRDPRGDRTETGYFAAGDEPKEYCQCHVPVAYDSFSGGVVYDSSCPKGNTEYIGLIKAERSFPVQIYVTDAQYVWKDIAPDVLPETSPNLPFFNNALSDSEYCGISNTEIQYNRLCRTHFDYFKWKDKQNNSE